jgi:HAD superfamily 5'-nucleotidase-like hydrolase
VGFDFDYTIVSYTEDLLELIYDMALQRLVEDRQYPAEMLEIGLRFDPNFSIRGLAVDTKTGWICHLSYTHKVAVAWEGRQRVPTPRIYAEYRGKRGMTPTERRKRLKPLNDLFSMSECCLIADTVQFFKDRNIPYNGQNVITDVLSAISVTHISGDFHRLVANNPAKYFEPTPHLKQVVGNLKDAGKRLIFVSNSPFWYVDAGMKYIFGNDWTKDWNAIIASAGKPTFYTEETRPFREVDLETARPMFKPVERFERGRVYTEGCLKELTRLMDWSIPSITQNVNGDDEEEDEDDLDAKFGITSGAVHVAAANVLYIGDSLFADLVDAKREFSWTSKSNVLFAFRIISSFVHFKNIQHHSQVLATYRQSTSLIE